MTTAPIHVFVRWKVKEGNVQAVLTLLKEVGSKTVQEKGNLFYQVHQSVTNANTLILFEGYTDETSQKAHRNTDHYKKLVIEKINPLLEEREVFLTNPIKR